MARALKGIRRRGNSWRVYVRVKGHQYTKTFPLMTPVEEMRAWRNAQQQRYGGDVAPAGGSFGDDIVRYLSRISAMRSYRQRAAHLELWAQALGRHRSRRSITAEEIEIVLNDWLTTPTIPAKGRPSGPQGLAPGTVRKRRTALQSFFAKMDGKKSREFNPVKGTDAPRVPPVEARALDYLTIERALAAMPAYCSVKPGAIKPLSLSKIRARVIAHTGIPPGLLQQILPSDLVLTGRGSVRVRSRRKGYGIEARTLPLTPDGLEAFKAFHAANAYGRFATSALNVTFKRACHRSGLDPTTVHLYDLRHSFLTEVYRVTRDLATVGRLGLHSAGSPVTARYAMGANETVDQAAVHAVGTALATQRQQGLKPAIAVHNPSQKVPTKATSGGKLLQGKRLRLLG